MKTILPLALAAVTAFSATAKLNGDGFYRVHNFKTDRYVYVKDDKGSVDYGGTTADVNALELWKDLQRAVSDPASIIYFEKHGDKWDLAAQGTSVSKIISTYVSISERSDGTYMCYGTKSGLAKYLGDKYTSDADQSEMTVDAGGDVRKWWIDPVNATDDNYFGIKPTVTAGGKYYHPFYASFPFSASSTGMKFYRINLVDNGMAVLEEITGTVPGATPVLVECSNPLPTGNRLQIGGKANALSGTNRLAGVYFQNHLTTHRNLTPYDSKTMRVLGVDSNGNMAFINPKDLQYIPANQCYLKVSGTVPDVIKIVTQSQYEEQLTKLPTGITLDQTSKTMTAGETFSLTATITPAAAAGSKVTWTSSNPKCASVSEKGLVTAVSKGTATITATTENNKTATCTVTVAPVPEKVTLSTTSLKFTEGESRQLTATVTPSDVINKTVTWSSSDTSIATVDETGNISGITAGNATVTATAWNGVKASCSVTVAPKPNLIYLDRYSVTLIEGDNTTLTATVKPWNVIDQTVTWSSSDPNTATVDQTGTITAVKEGKATVTATAWNGVNVSCNVTVEKRVYEVTSVTIEGATNISLNTGAEVQLTATVSPANATYPELTWESSNTNVATVSQTGLVKAVAMGVSTVSATASNGKKATIIIAVQEKTSDKVYVENVELTPHEFSGVEGTEFKLEWTISPENATNKNVTLSSNNTSIVTVDQEGNAKIQSAGTAVITIMTEDGGYFDTCIVTGTSGVNDIFSEGFTGDLYRMDGTLIRRNATAEDLRSLPKGLYIFGGRKVAI